MAYGACVPIWFDYMSQCEKENITEWDSRKEAIIFMALNYFLGALVFMIPYALLEPDACYLIQSRDLLIKAVFYTTAAGIFIMTIMFKVVY